MSSYSVDYTKLFPKGEDFRKEAKALNKCVIDIHNELVKMHKSWDGNQWGELANTWNHLIPDFGRICEFLVKQVPYTIEVDAFNYASYDGIKLATPLEQAPENIPGDLSIGTKGSIHLSDENASAEHRGKEAIDKYFDKILKLLDRLEDTLNSTKSIWISPAADKSRNTFSRSKETLKSCITRVKTQLNNSLNDALNGFKKQEEDANKNANAF